MPTQREIGYALIAISLVMIAITAYSTDKTAKLNEVLHQDCSLPEAICPFNTSIPLENATIFFLEFAVLIAGIYFVFRKPLQTAGKQGMEDYKKLKKTASELKGDEKKIYDIVLNSNGFIFQNELIEKSNLHKVAVTRILDKLEGKGLVERRRRGMSNAIVLKH